MQHGAAAAAADTRSRHASHFSLLPQRCAQHAILGSSVDGGDGHECQALGATSLEGRRRGGSVFIIALDAVLTSGHVIWPPQQRRLGVRVPREFTTWDNHDSAAAERLSIVAEAPAPAPGSGERLLKRAVAVTPVKARRHPPPTHFPPCRHDHDKST